MHLLPHVSPVRVRTFCIGLMLWAMLWPLPARAQNAPGQALQDIGIDQKLGQTIPKDLVFRDETGKPVRLADYLGGRRPVVLTLVYYNCPMLCTLVLNDTLRAMRSMPLELGKDYDVLTVSFDPNDTPELALKKKLNYLDSYRADPARADTAAAGWHFLTGDQAAIRQLTQAVGFRYTYDQQQKQFIHPGGIIILSPQGVITRYFYGISYSGQDVRLALVEAADGKVGTLAEQVLLLCYQYNPTTGRYSFAILSAIRAGGVLTVLAVGTFFFVVFRRERRLPRTAPPAPPHPGPT